MRALVRDLTAAAAGRGLWSVSLEEFPAPEAIAPGWVVVQPALSGITPADLRLLRADPSSPRLRDRYVPGQEIVGVVVASNRTRWARPGAKVIVEPRFSCLHKGLDPCRRCRSGEPNRCENRDRAGAIGIGAAIGDNPAHGGGWAEAVLLNEDQLLPAENIPDHRAVLAEPLARALHAVLSWEPRGERAAVIGRGVVGRLLIASLRRLRSGLDVTAIYDARADAQRQGRRRRSLPAHQVSDPGADVEALVEMGAQRVLRGSTQQLFDEVAELLGGRRIRVPISSEPILDRGFDAIFDCRGTPGSIALALRLLRPGGTLVLSGARGSFPLETQLLWNRDLSIVGAGAYGRESNNWRSVSVAAEWLADPQFPADGLVSHRFPLDDFASALDTAAAGAAVGAVRVVFEGPAAPLREQTMTEVVDTNNEPEEEALILSGVAAQVRQRQEV